jgi:hypothetical protein
MLQDVVGWKRGERLRNSDRARGVRYVRKIYKWVPHKTEKSGG